MSILEELLQPDSLEEFYKSYLFQKPYAAPGRAGRFRRLISWDLLAEIFATGYPDCWLPKEGRLPEEPALSSGRLTLELAQMGFTMGRTVLVRHSEKAHPKLAEIAADFHALTGDPIDIQLYTTPPDEEGFDWHYDAEEVFVIQSSGEKEFRLLKNANPIEPGKVSLPSRLDFARDTIGPEIRCHLKAGDWLYIPAGYWHKARALTPSFHLSVGVMANSWRRNVDASKSVSSLVPG